MNKERWILLLAIIVAFFLPWWEIFQVALGTLLGAIVLAIISGVVAPFLASVFGIFRGK
jgi:hypothetical protein